MALETTPSRIVYFGDSLSDRGALHDVTVGEREAIGGEHDARAGRGRPPFGSAWLQVEHGRRYHLRGRDDRAGIGIQQLGLGRRGFPVPVAAVLIRVEIVGDKVKIGIVAHRRHPNSRPSKGRVSRWCLRAPTGRVCEGSFPA